MQTLGLMAGFLKIVSFNRKIWLASWTTFKWILSMKRKLNTEPQASRRGAVRRWLAQLLATAAIASSPAVGAERPAAAQFRQDVQPILKEISCIGSFTDIRGGHVFPKLVRETENKPIRIFLEDTLNDNRRPENPNRDWHLQNMAMLAALTEKGYDVKHSFAEGTHSDAHGGSIMPEMLRWLWRDYPKQTFFYGISLRSKSACPNIVLDSCHPHCCPLFLGESRSAPSPRFYGGGCRHDF